jgi:hypothetical protein
MPDVDHPPVRGTGVARSVTLGIVAVIFALGIAGLVVYQRARVPGEEITGITIAWIGALAAWAIVLGIVLVRIGHVTSDQHVGAFGGGCVGAVGASLVGGSASYGLADLFLDRGPADCVDECHGWALLGYGVVMVVCPIGALLGGWVGSRSLRLGLGAGLVVGAIPWLGAAFLAALAFLF